MRIRLRHIISALLLLAALGSAAQDAEREARKQAELLTHDPENTEALTSLMFHHLHKADYRKAIDYGERLLDIGYARQDYHRSVLYAHIGLGQAYTMLGDSAAYNHLGQARINAENARNDSALCSVYNVLRIQRAGTVCLQPGQRPLLGPALLLPGAGRGATQPV